jgi:hypothetical protein
MNQGPCFLGPCQQPGELGESVLRRLVGQIGRHAENKPP